MKIFKIVLVAISGLFLVSCESSTIQDVSPLVVSPTYNANISQVITSKCTSCHSNGNQYPNLESYAEVRDAAENGVLLCRIDASCGNIMPQEGGMPQATITMIKTWATNNFPEN